MLPVAKNIRIQIVFLTATIGVISVLGAYWYRQKKKSAVPTKWQPVGKVKNLYLYPLKGGRRVELESALCTDYGLQTFESETMCQLRDRNLQVYNEKDNKNLAHPKLVLVETAAFDKDHFTLNAPGMSTLKVKIPTRTEGNTNKSEFWTTEKIPTVDCGDEAAQWISKYILESNLGLRLGYHDGIRRRNVLPAFNQYLPVYPNLRDEAMGMYSNITSYLIVNQASVDDLVSRIPESSVTANNFRPNILVEGASPFAEDDWEWVKIGDVIMYTVRPCTRCMNTTVNPETATRNENNEPLRTLRKYRRLIDVKKTKLGGYRSIMGINMGLHQDGQIFVGDTVYVV